MIRITGFTVGLLLTCAMGGCPGLPQFPDRLDLVLGGKDDVALFISGDYGRAQQTFGESGILGTLALSEAELDALVNTQVVAVDLATGEVRAAYGDVAQIEGVATATDGARIFWVDDDGNLLAREFAGGETQVVTEGLASSASFVTLKVEGPWLGANLLDQIVIYDLRDLAARPIVVTLPEDTFSVLTPDAVYYQLREVTDSPDEYEVVEGDIFRVSLPAGTEARLTDPVPGALSGADATGLYFVAFEPNPVRLLRFDFATQSVEEILRLDEDGAYPLKIVGQGVLIERFAIDETRPTAEGDVLVEWLPFDGGAAVPILQQTVGTENPLDIYEVPVPIGDRIVTPRKADGEIRIFDTNTREFRSIPLFDIPVAS